MNETIYEYLVKKDHWMEFSGRFDSTLYRSGCSIVYRMRRNMTCSAGRVNQLTEVWSLYQQNGYSWSDSMHRLDGPAFQSKIFSNGNETYFAEWYIYGKPVIQNPDLSSKGKLTEKLISFLKDHFYLKNNLIEMIEANNWLNSEELLLFKTLSTFI